MHPVLFEPGPFPVHAYGFMIAVGFLFGIQMTGHYAKKIGINRILRNPFKISR